MQIRKILTPLLSALLALGCTAVALAQNRGDTVLLDMQQAFRKGDKKQLAALLPQARGHALEPWAAYWELRARLDEATPQEVQAFFTRYAGSYQEDRLRNDWLLLLGQRRDWSAFVAELPNYRMNDDRELRCYALAVEHLKTGAEVAAEVRGLWHAQREADDGCNFAADRLYASGQLPALEVWRKARLAMEANRARAARTAVEIVSPENGPLVAEVQANPAKYLAGRSAAGSRVRKELVVLALVKIATSDAAVAAELLDSKWDGQLTAEERNWTWGAIGRQAAMRLSDSASDYFARVTREHDLPDDMLAWKARAALRQGQWRAVSSAIDAMSEGARAEPTWVYWKARAVLARARSEESRAEAQQLLQGIAGLRGFYEKLAMEELGQPIVVPAERPVPPTAEEKDAARRNPGLARALQAIAIGLRSEGVREWNYTTNLHQRGGMGDRELLAAAQLACDHAVWDRCINTSERTRSFTDYEQRFPTPYREAVVRRAREIGLEPAYVYGLIRQESRFVAEARSGVGASGLMQVMPATARWTARKIGLAGFSVDQLSDRETNIAIGTGYLKLVLDDFAGSMALAAAAYNAGPNRPRAWRNGPPVEAAIWAENVPFHETRDYVKKVLSNTTVYAALLTGQPQSLKARLGQVGPRETSAPAENRELP